MDEKDFRIWEEYKRTHSQELRGKIVVKYLRLVKYVAGRVVAGLPPNVEFEDLVGYGTLGLFDAIERYDIDKGSKFETYAASRIRGAIMDELRKLDWAPRALRQKNRDVEVARSKLQERFRRGATDDEIAEELGISLSELGNIYRDATASAVLSLDEAWQDEEGGKPLSRIHSVPNGEPDPRLGSPSSPEAKDIIAGELNALKANEKLAVVLYYYENLTLAEIGRVMNISESRVCQIHAEIFRPDDSRGRHRKQANENRKARLRSALLGL